MVGGATGTEQVVRLLGDCGSGTEEQSKAQVDESGSLRMIVEQPLEVVPGDE